MSNSSKAFLRRYTNLAGAIHLLQTKKITLLDPERWDDGNDIHFMRKYKDAVGAKSVAALCFAQETETYHHWKVFSSGTDGVCFDFDREKLLDIFALDSNVKCGLVHYSEIKKLATTSVNPEDLPFLKRLPYEPEREYRIVHTDKCEFNQFPEYTIPINCINTVTLSPWMPKPLVKSVKKTIKSIDNCKSLRVFQTTIIDNAEWKRIANRVTA
jgi:hypothetical protein